MCGIHPLAQDSKCFNMAELYMQDDEGESADGGLEGDEVGKASLQDEYLPPLIRLEKYATSDNLYDRQMVGRVALETLRAVADTPEDICAVMSIINRAAKDSDPSVTAELVEQIPHIAMICYEERDKLHYVVQEYLLPLIIKFLRESDNQVRKTTQAALLVLMEQGLVEMSAVENQVCPVILMLSELDNGAEYQAGAVALMSKMAPLIGRVATERLFMRRFAALCSDPVFCVRQACAYNFGEFCSVLGTEPTEEFLLPYFVELCNDGIWGVRKACAEVFMSVSRVCTLQTRKDTLAPVFNILLIDESRWVRLSAFQFLGPFISTFANLGSNNSSCDHHGDVALIQQENNKRFPDFEKLDASSSSGRSLNSVQYKSMIHDHISNICGNVMNVTDWMKLTDLTDVSRDLKGAEYFESLIGDDEKPKIECADELSSTPSENQMSESVVSNSDSTEQRFYCEAPSDYSFPVKRDSSNDVCSQQKEHSSDTVTTAIVCRNCENASSASYNTFQYWRIPIPDISLGLEDNANPTQYPERDETNSPSETVETKADVNRTEFDMDAICARLEQEVLTIQNHNSSILVSNSIIESPNNQHRPRKFMPPIRRVDKEESPNEQRRAPMKFIPPSIRRVDKEDEYTTIFKEHKLASLPSSLPSQNIVPQLLVDHFVSMTHPSQAQNTDNDITHYCAFSIPAVALTLGRANWNLIKRTYEALASDVQWKVRKTVASSIHELAVILGEELATKDLIPVFNGFIKDLDEVRIGVLKHLADFLKLLRPAERNTYLHRLSDFHLIDNECNWRFREELAEQLLNSIKLFSPQDTRLYITPIAIFLLMDKVAAVRQMALHLMTHLVQHVSSDIKLLGSLLTELAQQFAHNKHWNRRQTYALLCLRLLSERVLEDEQLIQNVFPYLNKLSWDPVPNVRLAVARVIACDITVQYFSRDVKGEELLQCLRRLQKDSDRDVRYFASLSTEQTSCTDTELGNG